MRRQIALVMCSAILGVMALSSHAAAQQKTTAACQAEWRANKAANQANGVTEKAYVAQCRSGAAPVQPTAAPLPPPAPAAAPTTAVAGQKTTAACRAEWRANKAANQANGVTEKAYVAQCRGGAAPVQPLRPQPHHRLPLLHRLQRSRVRRPLRPAERNGEPIRLPIRPTASRKRPT